MSDNVLLPLGRGTPFRPNQTETSSPPCKLPSPKRANKSPPSKRKRTPTGQTPSKKLTDITERVGRIWSVVSHLNSVVDTPELRAVYNELMPEITIFFTEIGQDIELYNRFKIIKNSAEFDTLSLAQQTKLNHNLRDFVLSGAELPPEQQAELAQLQTEGAQPGAKFAQNIQDATDAFGIYFDDAAPLAGIPEDSIAMFAAAAQSEGKQATKSACRFRTTLAVIQYADNRELREQIYRAYVTRASELSDEGKFDNTANVEQTLANALKTAKLLGFKNYAELSLATKMADTPEQVLNFLHDLARRAKPFAEKDFAEIKAFARENLNIEDPQSWDLSYAAEKLRQAQNMPSAKPK